MFEFFEVPSQAIGAIGPVAQRVEFRLAAPGHQAGPAQPEPDHGRGGVLQRCGQSEHHARRNGQIHRRGRHRRDHRPRAISSAQQLLNFNQIPRAAGSSHYICRWRRAPTTGHMLTRRTVALRFRPRHSPVPLVVTSTLANGTPATAIRSRARRPRSRAWRPSTRSAITSSSTNSMATPPALRPAVSNGNCLKTAWVQFLNCGTAARASCSGSGRGGRPEFGRGAGHYRRETSRPPWRIALMARGSRPSGRSIRCRIPTSTTRSCGRPRCRRRSTPTRRPTAPHRIRRLHRPPPTADATYYAGDPGVQEPDALPGLPHARIIRGRSPDGRLPRWPFHALTTPLGHRRTSRSYPPAIPVRRLFQVPDALPRGRRRSHDMRPGLATPAWPVRSTHPVTSSGAEQRERDGRSVSQQPDPVPRTRGDDELAVHHARGRAAGHVHQSQCR